MVPVLSCPRLSIGGSERKQRRAKKQASQGERAGTRGVCASSLPRPSSFFPRARRKDPLTEGLEQAIPVSMVKQYLAMPNVFNLPLLNPCAAEFSPKMPFFTVKSFFLAVMTLNWC